jgi:prepilin-type N-terminal cleavage/methylation domain-containing protein
MRAQGRQAGFTLIEILIALVVLVVGIVGVVSVFPVGIAYTADATGDTIAANLAESVHAALVAAHRNAVIPAAAPGGGVAPQPRVTLIHDLHPGNRGTGRYEFELPPAPTAPNMNPTPAQVNQYPYCHPDLARSASEIFTLANDPYMGETTRSVRLESDPTEPYSFYGFKFYVRKVPTVPIGGNSGLYEYTIYVFRIPGRGPLQYNVSGSAPMGPRYSKDSPPGLVTIPKDGNGSPLVPYWIMTARISGP